MQKFMVTWEKNGMVRQIVRQANNRESLEKYVAKLLHDCTNIRVYSLSSWYDSRIREHIQKLKIAVEPGKENDKWASVHRAETEQRLRCCADAALMFGETSQESLERTLGRAVDCGWEITGLDGHMFSFRFRSTSGGFFGGIIFHCSCKEWSSHT